VLPELNIQIVHQVLMLLHPLNINISYNKKSKKNGKYIQEREYLDHVKWLDLKQHVVFVRLVKEFI